MGTGKNSSFNLLVIEITGEYMLLIIHLFAFDGSGASTETVCHYMDWFQIYGTPASPS